VVAGKNIQTLKEEEKENEQRNTAEDAPDPAVQRRMAQLTKWRTSYQEGFCTDRTQPRRSALNYPTADLEISRYLNPEICEAIETWKQKQPRSERLLKQMLSALRLIAAAVRFNTRKVEPVSKTEQEEVVSRPRVPVAKISKANLYGSQIPFGSTTVGPSNAASALADAKAPNGAVRVSHRFTDSAASSEVAPADAPAATGATRAASRGPDSARYAEVIEADDGRNDGRDHYIVRPNPDVAGGMYWGRAPLKTIEQGFSTIGVQAGDDEEIRKKTRSRARPSSAPSSGRRPPSEPLSESDRSVMQAWMDRDEPASRPPAMDLSPEKKRPSSARSLHSTSTASSLARALPPRPGSAGSARSDASLPERVVYRAAAQNIGAELPPRPATAGSARSDASVAVNVGHRSEPHAGPGKTLPPRPGSARSVRSDSSVLVRIGRPAEAQAGSGDAGESPRRPRTADLEARNRELEAEIAALREQKLRQKEAEPLPAPTAVPLKREEAEGSDVRPATSNGRPATRLSTPRSGSDKHLRSTVQLGCFPATAFWGTEYQEEFNVLGKSMNLRIPGRKLASASDDASAMSFDALTGSERKLVRSLSARSRPSTPI
jgi:hypothetical protein